MSWFSNILSLCGKALDVFKSTNELKSKIVDYRLSDDAINAAKNKENEEFNDALENGDSRISDAIRKKKQKQIEKLKRSENL